MSVLPGPIGPFSSSSSRIPVSPRGSPEPDRTAVQRRLHLKCHDVRSFHFLFLSKVIFWMNRNLDFIELDPLTFLKL